MPLYNTESHRSCLNYATEHTALFRQYRLSDGERLSGLNEDRHVLVYVLEGSLEVFLEGYPSCRMGCGTLLFFSSHLHTEVSASGRCHFIASFFSGDFPLCDKYALSDLQGAFPQASGLNTPPRNFRKSL